MKLKKLLISLGAVLWMQPLAASPERIVTADGSLTEIVYFLGAEKKLAGVDTTSNFPKKASKLPQIGYKRAISVEGVLSLTPDVLLVTEDSGPPKSLNQLKQTGLNIKTFSSAPNIEAVKEKIIGVAEVLGKQTEGEALWQEVKNKVEASKAKSKDINQPVKVMFVLSMSEKSPIVAGHNTHAESIIKMAGGINAIEGLQGYKPISPEAVAVANPDVILMMARREHSTPAEELFSKPGFMLTNAAKNQRLISMDGMYLLGFGPRIGDAIEELSQRLYPQLITAQK